MPAVASGSLSVHGVVNGFLRSDRLNQLQCVFQVAGLWLRLQHVDR